MPAHHNTLSVSDSDYKNWELKEIASYLVCDIVGEPVKPLIESFSRGGTCALNIPDITNDYMSLYVNGVLIVY